MTRPEIGIMQGRLSRPVDGRIQAFPEGLWEQEFSSAKKIGLDAIEWIFLEPIEKNPLWSAEGRKKIKGIVADTGITINQICADYFMEHPFFRVSREEAENSFQVLRQLILFAREIGAKSLEIPFLDNSKIDNDEELEIAVNFMSRALPLAEQNRLQLAFETSLRSDMFLQFLHKFNHHSVAVVYDTGNSASLGFDPAAEIQAIGQYINNVHVKDRKLGSSTVPLGQGDANFEKVFSSLKAINYSGDFILQVARGVDGDEVNWAKKNIQILKRYLD